MKPSAHKNFSNSNPSSHIHGLCPFSISVIPSNECERMVSVCHPDTHLSVGPTPAHTPSLLEAERPLSCCPPFPQPQTLRVSPLLSPLLTCSSDTSAGRSLQGRGATSAHLGPCGLPAPKEAAFAHPPKGCKTQQSRRERKVGRKEDEEEEEQQHIRNSSMEIIVQEFLMTWRLH